MKFSPILLSQNFIENMSDSIGKTRQSSAYQKSRKRSSEDKLDFYTEMNLDETRSTPSKTSRKELG